MDIIGIIAEYNPFHNGHIYHLKKIKELYPNSLIILVLSSYFTQRGDINILTKESRVKIALDNGIDIVLELPVIYSTQGADIFAEYSIKILNNFGVDKIIFGSECGDIKVIEDIAKKEMEQGFDDTVSNYLSKGLNYPTSLAKALDTNFTFNPNDLLAISYVKAITRNNYDISPIVIKRTSNYHDTTSNDEVISASNIREKLNNNQDISKYTNIDRNLIIKPNYNIYFKLLKYEIVSLSNLSDYLDVGEGIEYRLKKYINESNSLDTYIKLIKTKRYTYNRINRMFIHILLKFKKRDNLNLSYIRILGFNKRGKVYLSKIKSTFVIPTKVDKNSIQYKYEILASIIYDLINDTNTYEYELNNKPIIAIPHK